MKQGQISVPAEVRQQLGLAPGSILQWSVDGDFAVVRRVGRFSSGDLHQAMFPRKPKAKSVDELKAGIRRHMRKRHARS